MNQPGEPTLEVNTRTPAEHRAGSSGVSDETCDIETPRWCVANTRPRSRDPDRRSGQLPECRGCAADEVDGKRITIARKQQLGESHDTACHVVDVSEVEGVVGTIDAQLAT